MHARANTLTWRDCFLKICCPKLAKSDAHLLSGHKCMSKCADVHVCEKVHGFLWLFI